MGRDQEIRRLMAERMRDSGRTTLPPEETVSDDLPGFVVFLVLILVALAAAGLFIYYIRKG